MPARSTLSYFLQRPMPTRSMTKSCVTLGVGDPGADDEDDSPPHLTLFAVPSTCNICWLKPVRVTTSPSLMWSGWPWASACKPPLLMAMELSPSSSFLSIFQKRHSLPPESAFTSPLGKPLMKFPVVLEVRVTTAPQPMQAPPRSMTNCVSSSSLAPWALHLPSFCTFRYLPVPRALSWMASPRRQSNSPSVWSSKNSAALPARSTSEPGSAPRFGSEAKRVPSSSAMSSSPLLLRMRTLRPPPSSPPSSSASSKIQFELGSKAFPSPSGVPFSMSARKWPPFSRARISMGAPYSSRGWREAISASSTSESWTRRCAAGLSGSSGFSTKNFLTLMTFFFLPMALSASALRRSKHLRIWVQARKMSRLSGRSRNQTYRGSYPSFWLWVGVILLWSSSAIRSDLAMRSSKLLAMMNLRHSAS
mmetsp:Transcript_98562/g.312687  ORF Transcript_98562/g.312687 Transcript_98562/m.312687 type:complete len:420 (-) Transcript_98562:897-2156(-)